VPAASSRGTRSSATQLTIALPWRSADRDTGYATIRPKTCSFLIGSLP
jgi:hypothetical protein